MAGARTVEEYLGAVAPERRAAFDGLRAAAVAAAPDASEVIAYDMPALRLGGRFLVSYAAYKAHFSLFPASRAVIEHLGPEIAPYLSGKGTIRFPASQPVPADLVGRVVAVRVAEVRAAGADGGR